MAAPNAIKRVSLVAIVVGICATWILVLGPAGSVLAAHTVESYVYDAPGHVVAAPQRAALVTGTSTTPTLNSRTVALIRGATAQTIPRPSTSSISPRRAAKAGGGLRSRLRTVISDERGEFDPLEFLKKKFPKEETTASMGDPREALEKAGRETQKLRDVAGSDPSAPTGGSRLRRGISALLRLLGGG